MQLVRWVHPVKVDDNGKLKAGAFPIEQLECINASDSISLTDLRLIQDQDQRNKVHEFACKFCKARVNKDKQGWLNKVDNPCNCDKENLGARGACSTEDSLIKNVSRRLPFIGISVMPAPSGLNPAHVLLAGNPGSKSDMLLLRRELLRSFNTIYSVQAIFSSI